MVTAIIVIGIVICVALMNNIDGIILSLSLTIIGGIAGYGVAKGAE